MTATGITATTQSQTEKQPRPFVLALLLTGILYFGVKPTLPTKSNDLALLSAETTITLSEPVTNAVLQHLSVESGLPMSALYIVEAQRLTWRDRCLGLAESGLSCTAESVPGWRLTVASGKQRWFYRTDAAGSVIIPEQNTTAPNQSIPTGAIARNFR
ncbi:MAG TPA: hypothetical protein DDW76_14130 [Cyanobacteria bacterium UBA11369]|nr:hypothetical protein [Cyanobacteria bacterium UBA11368]HBE49895.1 hypothetical protein [Cyanobacteria bacterium UBA11369]